MAVARKAFLATVVALCVIVGAIALWKVRMVIALLLVAVILAAAMRPGVEWLHARRVPRAAGVLLHYLTLLGAFALLVWLIVPQAISEVQQALRGKSVAAEVHQAAAHTGGIEHQFLLALDRRLRDLPTASELIHPAL